MPIYEYYCRDCNRQITLFRSISTKSSPRCSFCDSKKLTRLISQVSVIKSENDRIKDLSWVDKDSARRLKKEASGKLNSSLLDTLDRMESG